MIETDVGPLPETLPRHVWADFATQAWETRPTVLRDAFARPWPSKARLFDILARASGLHAARDPIVRVNFFVETRKIADCQTLLPNASDGTIEGWASRMSRTLAGRDYTLLLADLHLYDPVFWESIRTFLAGLHERVGLPCGGIDTGVFLGKYHRTPFGVHRGQMSVLTFPVVGVKRFRTWPRGYGETHPKIQDTLSYEGFLDDSSILEVHPGDVSYWPGDVWHIAEGSGEFTMAWNVGFWWDRPASQRLLGRLASALGRTAFLTHAPSVSFPFGDGRTASILPADLRSVARSAKRILEDGSLERELAIEWLTLVSGGGFRDVPPLLPADSIALALDDSVETTVPLLLRHTNGLCWVAANGHVFSVPEDPRIRSTLDRLRKGSRLRVSSILQRCTGRVRESGEVFDSSPEEVLDLLRHLIRMRAARTTGDRPRRRRRLDGARVSKLREHSRSRYD